MFLYIILIFIFLLLFTYFSTRNMNHWKKKRIKYVTPLPLFGNMFPLVIKSMSMANLIQNLYQKFPDERYVGIFQFTTPVLLIRDPELIKRITIKNFENFVDHVSFFPVEADPLWAKNLFSSGGERWRDLRQTISPVFTSSKMRGMFIFMDECAKQLTDYFKEQNETVITVDMKDITSRYANDIIATTAFGIKCDSFKFKNNEFLSAGHELFNFTGFNKFKFILYGNYPKLAKFLGIKMVNSKVGNFFRSLINETISIREQKNIIRPDLIHLLMLARTGKLKYENYMDLPEAGFAAVQESEIGKNSKTTQFLTNEDITAQAIVFFFGGFDTISSLMSFASYELAINPEIQNKLKEEINKTLVQCNGKLTYEHLLGMKYLDMVISETLRKWGQGVWLDRKCTKEFIVEPEKEWESPLKINVGDICWLPVFAIHRDPQYFPNPDAFDPERFNDENKNKLTPNTYMPFGDGPRNCIGSRFALLETKILIFYLLKYFDIIPVKETQIPLQINKDSVMLLPEKGFVLGLKKVNK